MDSIKVRLEKLREKMRRENIDYFLIGSSDYHASEYVGDFFKVSEYFSGCTSDNVKLVVGQDNARLWTDGRYFISAARELEGTGIELMKSDEPGVPRVVDYLEEVLCEGKTLAFDGLTINALTGAVYRKIAEKKGAGLVTNLDPADGIWTDRPELSKHKVMLLEDSLTGESYARKLERVREVIRRNKAEGLMLCKLDDICWLFNIRGGDITCNPVALTYAFIGLDTVDLFIQEEERTEEFDALRQCDGVSSHIYIFRLLHVRIRCGILLDRGYSAKEDGYSREGESDRNHESGEESCGDHAFEKSVPSGFCLPVQIHLLVQVQYRKDRNHGAFGCRISRQTAFEDTGISGSLFPHNIRIRGKCRHGSLQCHR